MERRAITVEGIVQGVGFRPFVYALASQLQLRGFVKNQTGRVLIEAEGSSAALDRLIQELRLSPPPLAQIQAISWEGRPVREDERFSIEHSDGDVGSPIFISPDIATCDDCRNELFDPSDRRYGYPFLNCTNCGPRLTIIRGAPYDRANTTMGSFPMCPECAAEYHDPNNRRFHAQPTACAVCGPRVSVCRSHGEPIETVDPVAFFVGALGQGQIGAIKGLGGFHLVCIADDEQIVRELRRRKGRDEKPFAVMVGTVESAAEFCHLDEQERALLCSPRRPIVLLKKRDRTAAETRTICDAVAPRNPCLGVMLPYTPLHHLLLDACQPDVLVMTSGNRSDEPIAYEDQDAFERLGDIADLFLIHNRPIHVRCDDSVIRIVDAKESPIRRSRGYAPQPVKLPYSSPRPILAVGGQMKGTFALGRGNQAFLSHHLGDLDHWEAYRAFVRDIGLYQELFEITPELLVHDLHSDYASTTYARERAVSDHLPTLAVQHHHAHVASCMAEHGLDQPVIGVSFDGTGFGTDGAIWGGEFLVADFNDFRRAAHLRYVGLPGGDAGVREPWRVAAAHALDAGCGWEALGGRIDPVKARTLATMLERRINTPLTSSAGRLFDAVASLADVRDTVSYEGQAAIELESLAADLSPDSAYPFEIANHSGSANGNGNHGSGFDELTGDNENDADTPDITDAPAIIDTRPLIRAVVADVQQGTDARRIARRFHSTVVDIIAGTCAAIRQRTRLDVVALTGGVFMNTIVASEAAARLADDGFRAYRHSLVPPNDGGLCLGQLAIGARYLQNQKSETAPEPRSENRTASITSGGPRACASPFPEKSSTSTGSTTS